MISQNLSAPSLQSLRIGLIHMKITDKEELGFWAFALGVLVVGVVLVLNSHKHESLKPIESIGEALMIAAALAITVDKYLKRRLMKDLLKSALPFLIGHDLPGEAQERIREILTKSTLIRRECLLDYKIEVPPDDPEKVRVELTATLLLDNVTSEDLTYQFRTCTSCCSCESAQVLRVWCRSRHADSAYEYPPPKLVPEGPDLEGNLWVTGKQLTIPPKNMEKDIRFEIGAKYETISKDQSDTEDYHFSHATLGVRVRVEYCEDAFTVYPVPKPSAVLGKSEWAYDRFFVPNEQVAIRWVRKALPRRKSDGADLSFPRPTDAVNALRSPRRTEP